MITGVLLLLVAAPLAGAVTVQEDFSGNPATTGWKLFGDTNLFAWDPANQNLQVTWDSSKTNSYFYRPLGTILARDDDFTLSFDLVFQDYASGTTPGLPFAFPATIGFLNLDDATRTNFSRGAGINPDYGPKNLVEFNFFPAFDIFRPTIAQIVVSITNSWLYNHDNLQEMTPGELFHVAMDYKGTTRLLTTVTTNNGLLYGPVQAIQVTNMDFRVAAVSVSSYSDQHADGSMLAHGIVDNLVFTVPPPPVQNLAGAFSNGIWQVQFLSRSHWLYTLERSLNVPSWSDASPSAPGTDASLTLSDTNPPSGGAFYRVRAERP